jgi:glycosyltransferase involved in cell wall biosynthesis
MPWTDSLSEVYGALDLLLLPSRFEGVPIVMLEAMYLGLPVLGADADGMQAVLPADWRFAVGSPAALAGAIRRIRAGVDGALLERNRQYVATGRNSAAFRAGIRDWVLSLPLAGNAAPPSGRQP